MEQVVFFVFISSVIIQWSYYLGIFSKLAFYSIDPGEENEKQDQKKREPVSVVICAKNEGENLKENLPHILKQDYPQFEVIVVNDGSEDDTADILREFSTIYKHLKILTRTSHNDAGSVEKGKKPALSEGIMSASYDLILLTDADCVPAGKNWIRTMCNNFSSGINIVLGYGAYKKDKSLLNALIRYDTFTIAIQYLSFALIGRAYMGVGRNLAYHKQFFIRNKGFESHKHVVSGDDDLFVNAGANENNVKIEVVDDARTFSVAQRNFMSWVRQKRRHLTTGINYKFNHKFLLGLLYASRLFFFLSFVVYITFFYTDSRLLVVAMAFIFLMVAQFVVLKKCMDRLGERDLLLLSPIYDLFFLIFNPLIFLSNLIHRSSSWT